MIDEERDEGERLAGVFQREREGAERWLDEAAAGQGTRLAPAARAGLAGWLVGRLIACAHTALDDHRRREGGPPEELAASLEAPLAWRAFLDRFPVVARLLGQSTAAWRAHLLAFLAALARDHHRLGAPAEVTDVRVRGGRLYGRRPTLIVTLAGGARWVYRAEARAMARWFQAVVAALNPALPLSLHARPILDGGDCSWDAFVASAPCPEEARPRFFQRAGMLIRLAERLAAGDFHCDNVVAAGEHPVLIDIETLFIPVPDASPATRALAASPLRSGFLSITLVAEPGRPAANASGLHPGGKLVLPFRVLRLAPMDGPDGGMREVFPVEHPQQTLPAPLVEHTGDLLAGYDAMERALAAAPDLHGLLAEASALPARVLGAGGVAHDRALHASLAPPLLASERARDAFLAGQPLDGRERAAIRDLELPRHLAPIGAHPAIAPAPPFTPAELARRHDLIRTAAALAGDRAPVPRGPSPRLSPAAHAVALGDFLLAVRFAGSEWHGAVWVPWAGARITAVVGGDLLSGRAGLALAFAQLHRVTGLPRFRDAALAALEGVPGPDRHGWLGAWCGLGGAIYALARCADLLGAPALAREAASYLAATPRPWLAEGPTDLILGSAGLLLGALALGPAPAWLLDAVHAAPPRTTVLPGGVPACAPATEAGIAYALARATGAPARWPPVDLLDQIDDAADPGPLVEQLIDEHARTGLWWPATSVAERHQTSAIDGLPAIILALLAGDSPLSARRLT